MCTCIDGLDSCDAVGNCTAIPPPPTAAPVVAPPTRCEICQACVTSVQPLVKSLYANTNQNNDPFYVASTFEVNCTALGRSPTDCALIKQDIAYSRKGNLGKRAGMLCTRLGDCPADLGTCPITVTGPGGTDLTAQLDVCTNEGVGGGQQLPDSTGDAHGSKLWLANVKAGKHPAA